ncbi:MAG TPA: metalloregulator ArsR/SmtB family transcription factor [Gemmatimonadaceae bacterium]|nr:metalloregulator ArsR/SmtB family transcription factor [Gemmatimonadaceae bacterium]
MATTTQADLSVVTRQFRALSEESRLRIVDLLRVGEQCVCDLQSALDIGQSLLSFHLKTLKDAGLVTDRREGRWAYYTLNTDAFAQLEEFVGGLPSKRLAVLAARCCG